MTTTRRYRSWPDFTRAYVTGTVLGMDVAFGGESSEQPTSITWPVPTFDRTGAFGS
jgi:hypothetical protein